MIRLLPVLLAVLLCVPALAQPFGEPSHCDSQLHQSYNDLVDAYESAEDAKLITEGYIQAYGEKLDDLRDLHQELLDYCQHSDYAGDIQAAQATLAGFGTQLSAAEQDLPLAEYYAQQGVAKNDEYCYSSGQPDKDAALTYYYDARLIYAEASIDYFDISVGADTALANLQTIIAQAQNDLDNCIIY